MGRPKGGKQVAGERKHAIVEMVRAGLSQSHVARFYNMSRSTVASIVQRSRTIQSGIEKRGAKRALSERCVRRLLRCVSTNRFKPLFVVSNEFRTNQGRKLSVRTIRRYLRRYGISSYVAVSKPFLSRKHINARLYWAQLYGGWKTEQWGKVAFTDESSFTLKPKSLRMRVWRKAGTRYDLQNMLPTFKSGYVTLSVWGAFSIYGRTPLVRIYGTLNQHKYRDILENYLLPFANTYHGGVKHLILQQDGCGPHRAKSINTYLAEKGVKVLQWPAQSPDLNPIENAWAVLKRLLRKRDTYPTSVEALFEELRHVWDTLPTSYFTTLVSSMERRAQAVKRANGRSTKY